MNCKIVLCFIIIIISSNLYAYEKNHFDQLIQTNICNDCDLSEAELGGRNLSHSTINRSNLYKAKLGGTNLLSSNLNNTNFNLKC